MFAALDGTNDIAFSFYVRVDPSRIRRCTSRARFVRVKVPGKAFAHSRDVPFRKCRLPPMRVYFSQLVRAFIA